MLRRGFFLLLFAIPALAGPDPLGARVDELVRRLSADDYAVRRAAYDELEALGTDALPWLRAFEDAEDPEVARLVARLVESARDRAERDSLDGLGNRADDFRRTDTFRALVGRGRAVIPLLLRVIDEEDARHPEYDYYRLRNAYTVLSELAVPEDLDLLLDRLRAPNIQHRILVEEILRKFDSRRVRDRALDLLGDPGAPAQQRAHLLDMSINSSFSGNEERFLTLIRGLVNDPAEIVRASALRYLMIRRDEPSLPAILARMKDSSPSVRAAAAQALSPFRTPEVRDALLRGLEDHEATVRAAAVQSLQGAGGPDLAPRIRPLLKDPDPTVRSSAAQILAGFGDRSALPTLIGLLSERNSDFLSRTLHAVVDALGRMKDPAALEPLFALLEDAAREEMIANYRYLILRAIVQIGGESVLDRIRPLITRPDVQNLQIVLDQIALIDSEKVTPILLAALAGGDRSARASAIRALVERGCAECAPLAAKALVEENDPWLLSEAVKAVTYFGYAESVPRILELLSLDPADNRNIGLFYALFRAAAAFRLKAASPRIVEIGFPSPQYRSLAIETVGALGEPAALPALRKVLSEEQGQGALSRVALAMARLGEPAPLEKILEGLAGADDPSDLQARAEALAALGRREELAATVDEAAKADPGNGRHLFNLACACASAGDADRAFDLLGRAIASQPFLRSQVREDPDLAPLRTDPRFAALLRPPK